MRDSKAKPTPRKKEASAGEAAEEPAQSQALAIVPAKDSPAVAGDNQKPAQDKPKKPVNKLLIVSIILAVVVVIAAVVLFRVVSEGSQSSGLIQEEVEIAASDHYLSQEDIDAALDDAAHPSYNASAITKTSAGELVVEGKLDSSDSRFAELKTLLDDYPGSIGLVIWACDGKSSISYNSQSTYYSACTIKAPYVYYVCQQLEGGNGSLDESITYEERYYTKGTGVIKEAEFGTEYSIRQLINLCINISDNVAYKMLLGRYGFTGYDNWLASEGLYSLQTDYMWAQAETPFDQACAWQLIYEYFQEDTEISEVFDWASWNSDWAYGAWTLPYDFNHKSGWYDDPGAYNDCGIVWTNVPYVYAVLSDSAAEDDGEQMNAVMELVNDIMEEL